MDAEALTEYLENELSPAIARIPGVSKINLVGGSKREARVSLNVTELESRGISALSVYDALRYNNLNVPAGTAMYRSRELAFTTAGAFSDLDELRNLAVGFGDGSLIFLKDIADITLEPEPKDVRIRSGGKDYVMVDVLKRDEGDTVKIVAAARKVLEEVRENSGGVIEYAVITDQSETTVRSLKTVFQSALTGLALTILVILFVLHDIRATVIISLSIPLSILFAILGLFGTGRSLNLLSLSGMTVAIGMIVDNSIVVLENTYKKFKKSGDRRLAALEGSGEVGGAVLASTTTSICVFAPLLFLTGIIGVIMNDLSVAIVFALAASALVSVIIVPWLSSQILKREDQINRPKALRRFEAWIDRRLDGLEVVYRRILVAALSNKVFTIAIAVSLLVSSVILLSILKINFLPPTDTGEFEIHIETPAGYSLERTRAKVDELDALVASPSITSAPPARLRSRDPRTARSAGFGWSPAKCGGELSRRSCRWSRTPSPVSCLIATLRCSTAASTRCWPWVRAARATSSRSTAPTSTPSRRRPGWPARCWSGIPTSSRPNCPSVWIPNSCTRT
jgi:HAE1 family hydrophobic/amphiphilic exporter-1